MKKVTISEAIADIREMFNIKDSSLSKCLDDGCFMIDKREFERDETIYKIQDYFTDKYIDGGQCRIEPITLLWTVFHIEKRK